MSDIAKGNNESLVLEVQKELDEANQLLVKRDFSSAMDVFDKFLQKDSECLAASSGKLFAEDEIAGIDAFSLDKLIEKKVVSKVSEYKSNNEDVNKEFFKKYEKNIFIAQRTFERNSKIDELESQVAKFDKSTEDVDVKKYYFNGVSPEDYYSNQLKIAIVSAFIAVISIFVGIFLTKWAFLVFLLAAGFTVYKCIRMSVANERMDLIRSHTAKGASDTRKAGELKIQINELQTENNREAKVFALNLSRMREILNNYELDIDRLTSEARPVQKLEINFEVRAVGLFAHVCPNCAGRIVLDGDTNLYICQSCGSRFERNYFMHDELLEKANDSMEQKEFFSAKEMCDFVLSKDSDNLMAKFFNLLIEDEIGGIKDYNSINLSSREIKTNSNKYMIGESGERKTLFADYYNGIKYGQDILENKKRITEYKNKITETQNRINSLKEELSKYANVNEPSLADKLLSDRDRDLERKLEQKRNLEEQCKNLNNVITSFNARIKEINSIISKDTKNIGAIVIHMKEILKIR